MQPMSIWSDMSPPLTAPIRFGSLSYIQRHTPLHTGPEIWQASRFSNNGVVQQQLPTARSTS
jgi:hypothetical protein